MILESRKGQELARHLARPIVAQLAPEEIEDFDDLAEDFFDPRLKGDPTLGYGLDLLPDLVVILMFVVATLEHLLARNGSAPPKSLLERLAKAVIHGQEVDRTPWFSAQELAAACEIAGQKARRLPESTQKQVEKLLRKLLPVQVGILFLGASPEKRERVRVERELNQVAAMIREAPLRDRIDLRSTLAVTADELQRALLDSRRPQILHFSGHGTETNAILLEEDSGLPRSISSDSLLELLKKFKDGLRLVVFNTCHSEVQARAVAAYVDAAVGMAGSINDGAAISFSRAFYRALLHGENLQRAFDLGCSQIQLDGFPSDASLPCLFVLREDSRDIILVEAVEHVWT